MVAATEITPREEDISKMLKCNTHLGTKNCDVLMEPYVFKRRFDGMSSPSFLFRSELSSPTETCHNVPSYDAGLLKCLLNTAQIF